MILSKEDFVKRLKICFDALDVLEMEYVFFVVREKNMLNKMDAFAKWKKFCEKKRMGEKNAYSKDDIELLITYTIETAKNSNYEQFRWR